jgi:hypothetical protein
MGKQIVVCHLPVPLLGAKTAVSPVLFLPEGKKDVTPRIGPRNGNPCSVSRASVPRRGPSRHPLICHCQKPIQSTSVNFGELSVPLISRARRPAPRPPSDHNSEYDSNSFPRHRRQLQCRECQPIPSLASIRSLSTSGDSGRHFRRRRQQNPHGANDSRRSCPLRKKNRDVCVSFR